MLQERLFVYADLKAKYGGDLTGVAAAAVEMKQEVDAIVTNDEELTGLTVFVREEADRLAIAGEELRRKRQAAALLLESDVERELKDLGMPRCRFKVHFEPLDAMFQEQGLDQVSFLIAPIRVRG